MGMTLAKVTALTLAVLAAMAQTPPPDPLARARQLYNEAKYDEAIEHATQAKHNPALANVAAIVLGRAHLERFRKSRVIDDLTAGRDALNQVDSAGLPGREYVELLVGLGEAFYLDACFDGCYTAAAELFERALARADAVDPAARELIFEWWAGALDRQAQYGPAAERKALYQRILRRSEETLDRNDKSAVATYWLAAAARGVDDVERAWGAAMAGWVRARHLGVAGMELRTDLDRLVIDALLPERARQIAGDGDARPALDNLRMQWDEIKKKFGGLIP
jgi:hypothetical protein